MYSLICFLSSISNSSNIWDYPNNVPEPHDTSSRDLLYLIAGVLIFVILLIYAIRKSNADKKAKEK